MSATPFPLINGRAMVSLGPLNEKRHCTYGCKFCYVESQSFIKYQNWDASRTVKWLEENSDLIEIIYISGDTDSFAPPRTSEGLDLLEAISRIGKDVLFTTRFVFPEKTFGRLSEISAKIKENGNLAIACVSVCQLSQPDIEPPPIKHPKVRIDQLGILGELGWLPVLAMRPIMPDVPASDFEQILRLAGVHSKYCLISSYYLDPRSRQLTASAPGQPIGKLFFDIGDYDGWLRIDPTEEVLSIINKVSSEVGFSVFASSADLYQALKRLRGVEPN